MVIDLRCFYLLKFHILSWSLWCMVMEIVECTWVYSYNFLNLICNTFWCFILRKQLNNHWRKCSNFTLNLISGNILLEHFSINRIQTASLLFHSYWKCPIVLKKQLLLEWHPFTYQLSYLFGANSENFELYFFCQCKNFFFGRFLTIEPAFSHGGGLGLCSGAIKLRRVDFWYKTHFYIIYSQQKSEI